MATVSRLKVFRTLEATTASISLSGLSATSSSDSSRRRRESAGATRRVCSELLQPRHDQCHRAATTATYTMSASQFWPLPTARVQYGGMKARSSTTKPRTTPSSPTRVPPTSMAPTTGRTKTSAAAAKLRLLRNGSIARCGCSHAHDEGDDALPETAPNRSLLHARTEFRAWSMIAARGDSGRQGWERRAG